MASRVWPSKIGTVPGKMVLVYGNPDLETMLAQGERWEVEEKSIPIRYAEAHQTRGGRWIRLPGYPWQDGYARRLTWSGHLCIDRR